MGINTATAGTRLTAAFLNAIQLGANGFSVAQAGTNDTLNSGSWTTMTGTTTSVPFTKRAAHTAVVIAMGMSAESNATAASVFEFGVLLNGTDYRVGQMRPPVSTRLNSSGFNVIANGLAADAYTIQGRWRRTSGTAQITRFASDDFLTILALEMPLAT